MDECQARGAAMNVTLHIDGKPIVLENVVRKGQEVSFTIGKTTYQFRNARLPDGSMLIEQETAPGVWQRFTGSVWQGAKARRVQLGAFEASITELAADAAHSGGPAPLSPTAPMPGLVRQLLVKKGEKVKKGQPLAVMEAMKLQMTLSAGADATVESILVKEGDIITEGTELVKLKAAA